MLPNANEIFYRRTTKIEIKVHGLEMGKYNSKKEKEDFQEFQEGIFSAFGDLFNNRCPNWVNNLLGETKSNLLRNMNLAREMKCETPFEKGFAMGFWLKWIDFLNEKMGVVEGKTSDYDFFAEDMASIFDLDGDFSEMNQISSIIKEGYIDSLKILKKFRSNELVQFTEGQNSAFNDLDWNTDPTRRDTYDFLMIICWRSIDTMSNVSELFEFLDYHAGPSPISELTLRRFCKKIELKFEA